jgi:hypothetical protein
VTLQALAFSVDFIFAALNVKVERLRPWLDFNVREWR